MPVTVPADVRTGAPARETAILITEGITLGAELTTVMPLPADLAHLTSSDGHHVYAISVSGWTVTQFVDIVAAYAKENFKEAARLTSELRPPRGDQD